MVEEEAARFSPDRSKQLVLTGYMIERITHFGVYIYLAGGHFDYVRPFLVDIEITVPIHRATSPNHVFATLLGGGLLLAKTCM